MINTFSRDTLNKVRHFINEETGALDCAHLNTFLELLKMAYDDPNSERTAAREI